MSALLRGSPQQACRALATRPDLQAIPIADVTTALCPFAKPHVAADVRRAATGFLSEAVYTRGSRDPCVHNLFFAFLVLQEDGRELHMCALILRSCVAVRAAFSVWRPDSTQVSMARLRRVCT